MLSVEANEAIKEAILAKAANKKWMLAVRDGVCTGSLWDCLLQL